MTTNEIKKIHFRIGVGIEIVIDNKTILSIYKIDNIQDLSEWVDNNLNNKPFSNINRILKIT